MSTHSSRHFMRRVLPLAFMPLLGLLIIFVQPTPTRAACPATFPVTVPESDTARLIEVINCANATIANDVINLTNSTYTLASALPNIATSITAGTLTINGNGATIVRSTAGGTPQFGIFTINVAANLTLNQLTASNGNTTANGGGIFNEGTLTLNEVTVSGNTAATGGGIYNNASSTLTITHSTISGNTAVSGGGIANRSVMRLINSTVSGNTVTGSGTFQGGGGLSLYNAQATQIINSTISNNTAAVAIRSGVWLNQGALTIQNSIVAGNNSTNNCLKDAGTTFTDGGNNLDNGTSCAFSGAVGQNVDPLLEVLGSNGGFTQTHALSYGSPAINAGSNAKALDHTGAALTTDQRGAGYTRINATTVDIGAYESVSCVSPMSIPAADAGGLRLAIRCSNKSASPDVINLASNSTYILTIPLYEIGNGADAGLLTINGNGATITRSNIVGTPQFGIFSLPGAGLLSLNQLTISNGDAPADLDRGGAIHNVASTLTLTDVTLSGNTAGLGGAIFNQRGTLTLVRTTISGNHADTSGAAIEHINSGTIWIINSTISGNSSGVRPTLNLFNSHNTHIINSTIVNNTSESATKAGIWNAGGTLTIQNSILANNSGALNCFNEGTLIDGGNNLDNGTSCGFSGAVGQNTNPLLAPLGNNGGFTFTHALLPGSPAINAGSNALAVDHTGAALTTDQRGAGFPRINNTTVDIGAYESIAGSLTVQLTLQGRGGSAPDPNRVVTTHVRIMPSGGGAILSSQDFVTNTNGSFTMPNLTVGTYLFSFKGTHTLARQATITIAVGTNNYTTAMLLEGDANDNNGVTLPDFSILATAFGKILGESGYDARADFNGDNVITINDFSLLASNFGLLGEGS